jgi:hypothetical protein
MNTYYFIADENIFNIDRNTEAVLATYGEAPNRQVMLLLEYSNIEEATAAERNFKQHYLPDLGSGDTLRLEDGTWAAIRRHGAILVVVLNASDQENMIKLVDQVVPDK